MNNADLTKRSSKRPAQLSPKALYEREVSIIDEKKLELEKYLAWADVSMMDLEGLKVILIF